MAENRNGDATVHVPAALLDRPIFEIAEAARLLGLGSTLYWWLNGRQTSDRSYMPALRDRVNKRREVTWGEFVEAAMLKELRHRHKVKLDSVRTLRWSIRDEFPETRYPLAEQAVYVSGRVLSHALADIGLEDEATYEPDTRTVRWGESVSVFLQRVEWEDAVPMLYRPNLDFPAVEVSPRRQFGAPNVDGMRTAAIFDLVTAGESPDWIAGMWEKPVELVQQAYAYEVDQRRARQAA